MKIAVVTGTSSGIGEIFAKVLLELNYLVVGGSRRESRLAHPNFIDVELDVRSEKSVQSFFEVISKKTEVIDVFVNNAGVCDLSLFQETNKDDFLNNFTTNVFGPFLMFKYLEEFLIDGATRIFNILSTAIYEHNEGTLSYSVSESAKYSLGTIIRKEWGKYNISFTDLVLPPVNTKIWDEYEGIDEELLLELGKVHQFFKHLMGFDEELKLSKVEVSL